MQWSNTEHIACCLTSDFELIDFVDCNSAGELTEALICSSAQIDRCLDNTDFTDVPDDLPRFNPFCRLVKHAVDVLRLFDRHCSGKSKKRKCITHFNTFAAYRRNECRLLQNVYHHFSFCCCRSVNMPTLAAGSGASGIQDRRADPQSSLWHRAPVSVTTQPCYRYIWSTLTPLLWHQPSRCTTLQTLYRRQPSFSGCRREDLERIAGHSRLHNITFVLSTPSENILVPEILLIALQWT